MRQPGPSERVVGRPGPQERCGLCWLRAWVALLLAPAGTPATFLVTATNDLPDANLADGICGTAAGTCTLRAAVQQANARAGADLVTMAPGVYRLGDGLPVGSGDPLEIRGAGPETTIVQQTARDLVLDVTGPVVITGIAVEEGNPPQDVPRVGGGEPAEARPAVASTRASGGV